MIMSKRKIGQCFSFGPVTYDDILKKYLNNLIFQIRFLNSDHFPENFCGNVSQCISKLIFPPDLKLADVTSVYKNKSKNSKDNYGPMGILSKIYLKFMKDAFMIKFRFSSILFCSNISTGSKKLQEHFHWRN